MSERKRPTYEPFMKLLREKGYTTIQEAHKGTEIPYMTLSQYADPTYSHKWLESLVDTADAFGISTDELISVLLAKSAAKKRVS